MKCVPLAMRCENRKCCSISSYPVECRRFQDGRRYCDVQMVGEEKERESEGDRDRETETDRQTVNYAM